jgi:hypothetical protein
MNKVTIHTLAERIDMIVNAPETLVGFYWSAGQAVAELLPQKDGSMLSVRQLADKANRSQTMVNGSHRVFKQFPTMAEAVSAFTCSDMTRVASWITAGMPSAPKAPKAPVKVSSKVKVEKATATVKHILANLSDAERKAVLAAL